MNSRNKIKSLRSLTILVKRWRQKGKIIAFTNGCFDILHKGHVYYLQAAKKKNRILIVGLNSDRSTKLIKGPQRPIVPEKERAYVLSALACVDYIVIFRETTPLRVIQALQPDVLIKGADWQHKGIVGSEIVKARGGTVERARYLKSLSTTRIIERISSVCRK